MSKTLKSISSTYLFKLYDGTLKLQDRILGLIKTGTVLNEEDLQDPITDIDRRFHYALKNAVLQDFRTQGILLLYNGTDTRLPNTLPTFLLNDGTGIRCFVNLSNYVVKTKNKDTNKDNYKIDNKVLFSLMQSGTITKICYEKYGTIRLKPSIIKDASYAYAKMFSRIISKMFSLAILPEKQDILIFLSSLFFLQNVLGRDEESMRTSNIKYALDNCKKTSELMLNGVTDRMNFDEDFADLEKFINAIARELSGLESLTVRSFSDNYITSYGPNTLLGLEYFPMFIHNLFCVMVGSFLNNQNVIESLCGQEISNLYKEFSLLV